MAGRDAPRHDPAAPRELRVGVVRVGIRRRAGARGRRRWGWRRRSGASDLAADLAGRVSGCVDIHVRAPCEQRRNCPRIDARRAARARATGAAQRDRDASGLAALAEVNVRRGRAAAQSLKGQAPGQPPAGAAVDQAACERATRPRARARLRDLLRHVEPRGQTEGRGALGARTRAAQGRPDADREEARQRSGSRDASSCSHLG